MKILQVVEQAFRTLVEEQDDTILWITQCMLSAGADIEVLLSGNCAYYAVLRQRQPGLKLGKWLQIEPADLPLDLDNLLANGVSVHVLKDDLVERGLSDIPVRSGVKVIDRNQLVTLYERVDQVWQW